MPKNQVELTPPASPSASVLRGTSLDFQVSYEVDIAGKPLQLARENYCLYIKSPAPVVIRSASLVSPEALKPHAINNGSVEFVLTAAAQGPFIADLTLTTDQLSAARHEFELELQDAKRQPVARASLAVVVTEPPPSGVSRSITSKDITTIPWRDDVYLYAVIKHSSAELSFKKYKECLDLILCGDGADAVLTAMRDGVVAPPGNNPALPTGKPFVERRFLPFNDTDAYRILKVATEAFVAVKSGVGPADATGSGAVPADALARIITDLNPIDPPANVPKQFAEKYLEELYAGGPRSVLPYYKLILDKMGGNLKYSIFPGFAQLMGDPEFADDVDECEGVLVRKLTCPLMVELIWSYWHEQGMQAQTMFALRDRFQNKRSPVGPDPLAAFEMSHLRPLNNILWGYIQDEQHRLTLTRRAYEYDHHYGLKLQGTAVPPMQTADSRSRFLEAFHNLLATCVGFFKEDDDTNRKADAFPVLNALKEVHFLLSEGAHNQYGDLPTTSRIEMLMEQWILARPEMQRFLPYRESIAYPEDWMGTVDAMKAIQGWTNTSVLYFHDLANFGEQILLSVRFNNWSQVIDRNNAAAWARVWRSEIQGYMHAYRTVTGVDLAVEAKDAPRLAERNQDPSVLLQRRYDEQRRLGQATRGGQRLPAIPTAAAARPSVRPVPLPAARPTPR